MPTRNSHTKWPHGIANNDIQNSSRVMNPLMKHFGGVSQKSWQLHSNEMMTLVDVQTHLG